MMRVFFIAGTPGTGKTTIGNLLSGLTGITFLELRDMIGEIDKHDEVAVDGRILSSRAGKILRRCKNDVFIASHIPFKPRGMRVQKIILLRRDPYQIINNLRNRCYSEDKVLENAEAELLDIVYVEFVSKFGRDKVCQIDVSNKRVEECIDIILRCMKNECICEEVDWITRLEKENRLTGLLSLLSTRSRRVEDL